MQTSCLVLVAVLRAFHNHLCRCQLTFILKCNFHALIIAEIEGSSILLTTAKQRLRRYWNGPLNTTFRIIY